LLSFFAKCLSALACSLGFGSCLTQFFYDQAVARKDKSFLLGSSDLKGDASAIAAAFKESALDLYEAESLSIVSADGIPLKALWIRNPASSDAAIVCHGYSSSGARMAAFARVFADRGLSVLLPDARGHGASGGDYIGFGWPERLDLMLWIDQAKALLGPGARIVLFGLSMGASTVLMASGEALPPEVRGIIADCGYTSAYDILAYQLKRMYGLGPEPLLSETSKLAKARVGYSFEEASALEQARKAKLPALIIHGEADSFVPYWMGEKLYEAYAGPKDFFSVPGAGHALSHATAQEAYEARIEAFLARVLP
jgi:hypothetical protein